MLPSKSIIDDQFEVVEMLGSGGFSVVYKARQLALGRIVALKVLQPWFDQEACTRFKQEAQVLSALDHRHLVAVYGGGVWQNQPYMATEFLHGTSLQTLLQAGQHLPIARTITLLLQVLDGLAYVHSRGLVHRDLKPDNIFIVNEGGEETAKIIDFGLVKLLKESGLERQRLTATGHTVGTIEYMSPEQCLASKEIDSRSDLYAVGCIFYRCISGSLPFQTLGDMETMLAHINSNPLPLTDTIVEGKIEKLQLFVNKALAKRPEDRYQCAEEMANDLRALLGDRSGELLCAKQPVLTKRSPGAKSFSKAQALLLVTLTVISIAVVAQQVLQTKPIPAKPLSIDYFREAEALDHKGTKSLSAEKYVRALELQNDGYLSPRAKEEAASRASAQFFKAGDLDRARKYSEMNINEYWSAVRQNEADRVWANFILICNAQDRPQDAIQAFKKRTWNINSTPDFLTWRALAQSYILLGDLPKVKEMCNNFIPRASKERMYKSEKLGQLALAENNLVEAKRRLSEITEDHMLSTGHLDPVWLAIQLGDYKEANRLLVAFKKKPSAPAHRIEVLEALLEAANGNFDSAKRLMQSAIERTESNHQFYRTANIAKGLEIFATLAEKSKQPKHSAWAREEASRLARKLGMWAPPSSATPRTTHSVESTHRATGSMRKFSALQKFELC